MLDTVTFILPDLFDDHCRKFLEGSDLSSMEQLTGLLARAHKVAVPQLQQWISENYNIDINYTNSTNLMAVGEGLITTDLVDECYWLRADPVMLTATHNGILCRGNRLLNLSEAERTALQVLVNDYLQDQQIELMLPNATQGYLRSTQPINCQFTSLAKVMGQDISQRLPIGENAPFWHQLLTDLQMLLHNCAVNQQRRRIGSPIISGFWLWAGPQIKPMTVDNTPAKQNIFTDDPALAGALGKITDLQQLGSHFDPSNCSSSDICIHVAELQEAYLQNDKEGWLVLYQRWVKNWLLPALMSVNEKKLLAVQLLSGDGYQYQYNAQSRWCFWRRHSFLKASKQI